MTTNISKFEKKLKIKVKNKPLIINALTHKSSNYINNNEKLEFLGDRVIGLILSKKLFDLYPNESEGDLDKRFAKLVNRETCAFIGMSIGVGDFIILGDQNKKITKKDEKILCDTCEAIIGAIYIDRGYNYVKDFVLRLWKNELSKSGVTILDAKTKLQEHSLKLYKKLPSYKFLTSKGPKHNPIFKISVSIPKSRNFIGTGNSKKEAEQNAASNLLKGININ
jgi:ribonuclease-3